MTTLIINYHPKFISNDIKYIAERMPGNHWKIVLPNNESIPTVLTNQMVLEHEKRIKKIKENPTKGKILQKDPKKPKEPKDPKDSKDTKSPQTTTTNQKSNTSPSIVPKSAQKMVAQSNNIPTKTGSPTINNSPETDVNSEQNVTIPQVEEKASILELQKLKEELLQKMALIDQLLK